MSLSLRAHLERLRAATPRERAGLALVVAIAACAAALWAFDEAMQAGDRADEARARYADLQSAYAREGALAFQQSVAIEANKVWRWSIVQSSPGVARAQAVTALEGLALQAGLSNYTIELDEAAAPAEVDGVITPIRLVLSADFDWVSFQALLQALAATDLSFVPEAVGVEVNEARGPTLSLTLRVPFLNESQQP
jgi:hypothetical protein